MDERGIAYVTRGIGGEDKHGKIIVERGGGTVYFEPDDFRAIDSGDPVYFRRRQDDKDWAELVYEAPDVAVLLKQGIPQAGLTRYAHAYLRTQAVDLVSKTLAAETSELADQHQRYAQDVMKSVATLQPSTSLRVSARAVREAFATAEGASIAIKSALAKAGTGE